ncbi:AraC family transcriptional regulator [Belliella kenyensis]|uniref:AraC family transcriptional regulator n=1 Tax=Belliella kenyensis TaxID=1472724 RepID=A0ABV8EFH1_9BACT|nr:helix-turn-helix domain-containing protein [Belliella kenyensis]MCH7401158.1 helix-turn-helix domain-containing protein [Belliella kenyensis]MDN3604155.1 helix-turn-helix domain-containing protein [Belliella kenyensis]
MYISKLLTKGLIVFFCVLAHPTFGQNLKFKTYQVQHGLSNNSINVMINDPSGGIWIGTWDGLNFFDGNEFSVFSHQLGNPSSLSGNYIVDIKFDHKENLWVWADPESVSLKSSAEGFTNFNFKSRIASINLNKLGNLLVFLADGHKLEFLGGEFISCKNCEPRLESTSTLPVPISKDKLLCSYKDKLGNLWWGTRSMGLFFAAYNYDSGSRGNIKQFHADPYNPYGLKSSEVTCIIEDDFGNIWLGLKDGGIARMLRNGALIEHIFAHPKTNPELVNETVRAVAQDRNETLWMGYYTSGIYYRKKGEHVFQKLFYPNSLSDENWKRTRSIFEDSEGTLWVGTYQGVFTIKNDKIDKIFDEISHSGFIRRNYGFAEDVEKKQIWIASWGGVMLYDITKGTFIPFQGQSQLKDQHVRSVSFYNGKLYVATEKSGVIVLDSDKTIFFDSNDGLLDNSTYAVFRHSKERKVFIGTHSGITIWDEDTGKVSYITQKDGLLSDLVYSLFGHDDKVWFHTTKGVGYINLLDYSIRTFPPDEGWQSSEFSEGASFQSANGTLFYGGINGVNYFHPDLIDSRQLNPIFFVEQVSNYKADRFEAKIKEIAFGDFSKGKYEYRILPSEPQWKSVQEDGNLYIDKLKDGEYLLEIKNLNDSSGAMISKTFQIASPIYTKWYFYVFPSIILLAISLLIRQYQFKIVREKLARKVTERTAVIAEQTKALERQYKDLDLKNKEIEAQKTRLLELHNRQQHSDMERNEFVEFLLKKIKPHLIDLNMVLEEANFRDLNSKALAFKSLSPVMLFMEDLETGSFINQLDPPSKSLTLLPDLFHALSKDLEQTLVKHQIDYSFSEDLCKEWVLLDVTRLKLFLQYLFKGLIRFLDKDSFLDVFLYSSADVFYFQMKTDSQTLIDSFTEFDQYNLNLQASRKVLIEVDGTMRLENSQGEVMFFISIPFSVLEEQQLVLEQRHWKHLDLKNQIPAGKKIVLLYGKQHESDSLVKLLDPGHFFLITEHESEMIDSALLAVKVDVLVIYNEKITDNVATLLNAIQSKDHLHAVPVVFIYEHISPSLQEKLMDMGVGTFVKLPMGVALVNKTIKNLIKEKKQKDKPFIIDKVLKDVDESLPLSPNEKLVREAFAKIRASFSNPDFKLESLADEMKVSKIKLYRIFKEIIDKSPSDIIIQLRMEKAEKLLQQSQMNISEISYSCGFNDPKHFSKLFKKYHGVSPKSYQLKTSKGLLNAH